MENKQLQGVIKRVESQGFEYIDYDNNVLTFNNPHGNRHGEWEDCKGLEVTINDKYEILNTEPIF